MRDSKDTSLEFFSGKRILVTGGNGFLGRHVVKQLHTIAGTQIFISRHRDYNLIRETDVKQLLLDTRPEIVIHLAGLVGGIQANRERPADFYYQNLLMGTLLLHYSYKHGAQKYIAAGAGCGYPENASLPLKEDSLWEGTPQKDSQAYSLAKRMLTIQSQAYAQQYNFTSIITIPGNLYGPGDNFDLHNSHVVPALVRKFVEAVRENRQQIEVWGSGAATRDFIYAGDAARGLLLAACHYDSSQVVNLASGKETSISQVCTHLSRITGFNGEIVWDRTRPEGQTRRVFDVSKAHTDFGFQTQIDIYEGLKRTAKWYRAQHANISELSI